MFDTRKHSYFNVIVANYIRFYTGDCPVDKRLLERWFPSRPSPVACPWSFPRIHLKLGLCRKVVRNVTHCSARTMCCWSVVPCTYRIERTFRILVCITWFALSLRRYLTYVTCSVFYGCLPSNSLFVLSCHALSYIPFRPNVAICTTTCTRRGFAVVCVSAPSPHRSRLL